MSRDDPPPPSDAAHQPPPVARAAELLREGGLVAFPTETVYGLGADATNDTAIARLYAAKGRPSFNPLIVHVARLEDARRVALFDEAATRLAEIYWPGPLSLVLPRAEGSRVSLLASAGLPTVALRIPAHPLAQAMLRAAGRPIAAPSANRSGRLSPTTPAHVQAELGDRIDLILDGGPCRVGIESTVLDLTGDQPLILRPGGVTREALQAVLGPVGIADGSGFGGGAGAPRSPGQLPSHYAPNLPLRLDARDRRAGEAFIAFGAPPEGIEPDGQLSADGDPTEAAARLFASLRALDRPPFLGLAVAPVPDRGLGLAINDRLKRAAAPRPAATAVDRA